MADPGWLERLRDRLGARREAGLLRSLAGGPGAGVIDLSGNDYLCLRRHPELVEAAREACARYGVGAGSSRLIAQQDEACGRAEAAFARFKGVGAGGGAVLLPTGYAANLAVMGALVERGDLVLCDRLAHASVIDGARLASGAHRSVVVRTFAHNDVAGARRLAERHLSRRGDAAVWIVTDAVFSMDGDLCDLAGLAALRDELSAGWAVGCGLVVDEAHATGVIGPGGAGLDAAHGHAADVVVSTASKALGGMGGVVTSGRREVVEGLVNFGRALVYSTGMSPAQAAVVEAAVGVVEREVWRRERLGAVIGAVRSGLRERGWAVEGAGEHPTPIIPLEVGTEESALGVSSRLRSGGVWAPAVRPPTVPRGRSRVRLSVHAGLSDSDVARVLGVVGGRGAE